MTSKREILEPTAKPALEKLKIEVANETLGKDIHQKIDSANYENALAEKKREVAEDLGLKNKIDQVGWGNMTTEEVGKIGGKMGGKIGGNMVKKMIAMAESQMAPVEKEVLDPSRRALEKDT